MIISSPANERLKQARRVREGREPDLMFLEGERLIEECLATPLGLLACFHPPELSSRSRLLVERISARGCPTWPTTEAVLTTVSDTVNPQGLILLAERPRAMPATALAASGDVAPILVGLDAIQDPGNLGTIVRTAEAAGADGLITLKGCVDAFAPKTLRSAMGSAFRLPMLTEIDTDQVFSLARHHHLLLVATTGAAAADYTAFDWSQPSIVFFGNEANGLRSEILDRADVRVRIPMRSPVESLNVAAAAAAILFECARQRGIAAAVPRALTSSAGSQFVHGSENQAIGTDANG